jgi:hypothetical protein
MSETHSKAATLVQTGSAKRIARENVAMHYFRRLLVAFCSLSVASPAFAGSNYASVDSVVLAPGSVSFASSFAPPADASPVNGFLNFSGVMVGAKYSVPVDLYVNVDDASKVNTNELYVGTSIIRKAYSYTTKVGDSVVTKVIYSVDDGRANYIVATDDPIFLSILAALGAAVFLPPAIKCFGSRGTKLSGTVNVSLKDGITATLKCES